MTLALRYPKQRAMRLLEAARNYLSLHDLEEARFYLDMYRAMRRNTPASTLRRWRCGK